MRHKITPYLSLLVLVCTTSCRELFDYLDDVKPFKPQVTVFATGLTAPLGIESDTKGQLWITEAGTGFSNDGQLSLITPQGKVYPAVTGFPSSVSPEGGVFGLNHLVLQGNTLWLLHGVEGKLYKFDISSFRPGDAPLQASELEQEDIGTFVKDYAFEHETGESDVFNLTVGPEGDLFIVDAGANAIIRRQATTGKLSIFTTIPPVANPGGDPVQVEAVPTGIVFDGYKFLVCSFTGYPFPARQAPIYQVDLTGNISVYQTGLSSLADIDLGIDKKPLVVEYGTWAGEAFAQNSGSIVQATAQKNTYLVTGLNFPNSIERTGPRTCYVAQTFDGIIQKVNF